MHKRSKHTEPKFRLSRIKTKNETILILYVPTAKLTAEIFAKTLQIPKAKTFRTVLMGANSTQNSSNTPTTPLMYSYGHDSLEVR